MADTPSFDFETPIDRRGTASEKWDRYAGRDILPLWVADMDFRSPPAVIKALHRRVEHGVFGYTAPPHELIATVQEMLQREYDWQVPEEWLVWLPGLVCGLNVTCRAVGEPGDAVATFTPVYPPFFTAPRNADRELIDARGLGVASPTRFFEEAGIGLSDGNFFGAPGFVRLNFGCPQSLLKTALERMQLAITRNRSEG